MSSGNELQTLRRGLQALVFLNQNGPTNLADLARYLEIPRANAFRIVMTLVADGYCVRMPNSRKYSLTPLVQRLSGGFDDESLLTTVAREPVARLSKEVRWPIAVATPYGSHMLVRLATDHDTPLALTRMHPGHLAPIVKATTGILYLALTKPAIRAEILNLIRKTGSPQGQPTSDAELTRLMTTAAKQRYLIMDNPSAEANIGVPIMSEGEPVAGLVMRYIRSAMTREEVVSRYLPKLRATADEIASAMERGGRIGRIAPESISMTWAELMVIFLTRHRRLLPHRGVVRDQRGD